MHFLDYSVNLRQEMEELRKRALLIFNPIAGEKRSLRLMPEVIKRMTESGYICTALTTTGRGSATEIAAEHGAENDVIVCSGGDGTANEVIRGMMQIPQENRPLFSYIPTGSTNDFADALEIPTDVNEIIDNITQGDIVPIDTGLFNDRYYAYVCAFGAFTDASYSTSQLQKNIWGSLAYFIKGISSIKDIKPIRARFTLDNKEVVEDDFVFCSISNSKIIGGIIRLNPGWVDMNDGKFEILLIKYPKNGVELGKIVNAITTRELKSCELIRIFSASDILVESLGEKNIDWSLDGEGETDVKTAHVINMHSSIRTFVNRQNRM